MPDEKPVPAVYDERHLFRSLMEHFSDRIYYKDLTSRFLYASRAFVQLFQLNDLSELVGKTDFDFFSETHARAAFDDEQEIIRTGKPKLNMEELETWPDGSVTWAYSSKAPFKDEAGRTIGTFGISRDITAQKLARDALQESEIRIRQVSDELATANQSLQELTFTDPLTSLRNRRFLLSHMPSDIALVERALRNSTKNTTSRMKKNVNLLFLMVDLDHFKKINDHWGHLAGDLVLKDVGEILRRVSRTSDTVARVGGEEFLVVSRQSSRESAQVVAERIRAAVEAYSFSLGGKKSIRCTCSVGFSIFPLLPKQPLAFSWEQVVEIADNCLYLAKHAGRNAWVGSIPDQKTPTIEPEQRDMANLVRSGILPTIRSS